MRLHDLEIAYNQGRIKGINDYAWYKDGCQYVGTCGKTYKKAVQPYKDRITKLKQLQAKETEI
jgi:hypothetical protein